MLLKVEVFPAGEPLRAVSNNNNNDNSNSNNSKDSIDALHDPLPIASSQPPLYVCLGTSGKPSSKLPVDKKKKKKKQTENDGDQNDKDEEEDNIADDDFVDPDAGRLLTVGRAKVGAAAAAAAAPPARPTVLIPATDKSVSREHCLLRLVASKDANMQDYKFHPRPMASRNDAEEEACFDENNNSTNGLCVVVESMGKLGTYLVVEQEEDDNDKNTSSPSKVNKDDEDDETDDEEDPTSQMISQQQQQQTQKSQGSTGSAMMMLPPLSDATKQLVKNPTSTMLVPVLQPSMVLEGLASAHGRVILQCGKMGSTVVISRVPLHFVQAGARKGKTTEAALPWHGRLYVMGATEGETVTWMDNDKDESNNKNDGMPTTLVLTEKYNATQKQLAAWSRGGSIPLVTPDYMQALLDRKRATDPLPKFSDHVPQSDGNAFWQQVTANPNLWQGAIFLSTDDGSSSAATSKKKGTSSSSSSADATEMLLASAGAKIVQLYKMSTEQLQEVARRLEEDDAYRQACFGLQQSSSSSSGRGGRRSKSKAADSSSVVAVAAAKLLSDYSIPLFSTRTFAKLLTQQKRLTAPEDGRVIGASGEDDNASAAAAAASAEAEKAPAKGSPPPQEKSKEDETTGGSTTMDQETPPMDKNSSASTSQRRRGEASQENSAASASQEGEESASLLEQQEGRNKKQHRQLSPVEEEEASNKDETSPEGGAEEDDKVMPLPRIANNNKRKVATQQEASQEDEPSQDKDESSKKKEKSKSNKRQKKSLERTGERRSLDTLSTGSTKQGWLVTAPHKDSKRQAYCRNKEEIMDEGGYEELVQVAETQIVKGLLRKSGQEQRRGPNNSQNSTTATIIGPDYKRFWKNEIAGRENTNGRQAGGEKNRPPGRRRRFVMKVAGKNRGDDIVQSEYHEQRQALEEQERRADQLFRDPTARAPRRRRAKA